MNQLFKFLCSFSLLFFQLSVHAQHFHWAKAIGGYNFDSAWSMETDSKGNVYTLGHCSNYLDVDPGPGQLFSAGLNLDIFIVKLNPQGNFLWAKRIGSAGTQKGFDITVDAQDNVFATGYFAGTTDFDPGPAVNALTCAGAIDMFLLKLDSAGSFQWVKQIGSAGGEEGHVVQVSPSGFIYLTGKFSSTSDFDPGPGVYNLTAFMSSDVFISKYDSNGNFIWAKSIENGGPDDALGMSIDSLDNVWVTGSFMYSADFDPSSAVYNLTAVDDRDIFVLKLDSSGAFQWAHRFGDIDDDYGHTVLADAGGNSYVSGWYIDTCDFDPGPATAILQGSGYYSMFLLKLDAAGNMIWVKQTSGLPGYPSIGFETKFDSLGNVYYGGYFGGIMDFDPGPGIYNLTSALSMSIGGYSGNHFILSLDTAGAFRWARGFGGPTTNSFCAMAVTKSGEVFMSGYFNDSIKMHPNGIHNQLNSIGQADVFITKYGICPLDSLTSTITVCNAYQLHGQVYALSGSYAQVLAGTTGCDTAFVFNLTVNHPNIAVTQSGITLTSSATAAQYQWINCSGNVPIAGANSQVFTPTTNGSYAVIVTANSCSDTSLCKTVTGVGINENIEKSFSIYPNPASQQIIINTAFALEHPNLRIINLTGEVVLQQTCRQGQEYVINVSSLSTGLYIIEVEEKGIVMRGRFTKVD